MQTTERVSASALLASQLPSTEVKTFESPCCTAIATVALHLFHSITASAVAAALLKFAFKATVLAYTTGALVTGLMTFALLSYLSCSINSFSSIPVNRKTPRNQNAPLNRLPLGTRPGSLVLTPPARPATPPVKPITPPAKPTTPLQPGAPGSEIPTLTLPSPAMTSTGESPRINDEPLVVSPPGSEGPSTPLVTAFAAAIAPSTPKLPEGENPLITAAPAAPTSDRPKDEGWAWRLVGYGYLWGNPS